MTIQQPSDQPPDSTVWSDVWTPTIDAWDPNADTGPWGENVGEHGDIAVAEPVSEQYGQSPSGTVPDVRANLLTDIRRGNGVSAPPGVTQHHVVETVERGAARIRARVVRVVGNLTEASLLEQNDGRTRALIKVVTSASVIIIGPARQGGNPQFNATPTGPSAWWYQATGDAALEVKASGAVSAYGTAAAGAVDVAVWEEIETDSSIPGLY